MSVLRSHISVIRFEALLLMWENARKAQDVSVMYPAVHVLAVEEYLHGLEDYRHTKDGHLLLVEERPSHVEGHRQAKEEYFPLVEEYLLAGAGHLLTLKKHLLAVYCTDLYYPDIRLTHNGLMLRGSKGCCRAPPG